MNTYLKVLTQHYADFKGRARRRDFWVFTLVNFVLLQLLQLPYNMETLSAQVDPFNPWASILPSSTLGWVSFVVSGLFSLVVLIPGLAVTVRRLHDTGRSGWWVLLFFLPLIGPLVLLIFALLDSQPGSNRWGVSPKGAEAAPEF